MEEGGDWMQNILVPSMHAVYAKARLVVRVPNVKKFGRVGVSFQEFSYRGKSFILEWENILCLNMSKHLSSFFVGKCIFVDGVRKVFPYERNAKCFSWRKPGRNPLQPLYFVVSYT